MRLRPASLALLVAACSAAFAAACGDHDAPSAESACQLQPTETFHERIEPLLVDSRVSTCNECHLSGVDLSAFARDTPCKTWACLSEQGLVDVKSPDDSKILAWIQRASPDSKLITKDVIQAEYTAFRDWIEANAACPQACADVTCGSPDDGPTCDEGQTEPTPMVPTGPDTRGCSDLDLEQAFRDDVYSWRGRCAPCHFDTELNADAAAPRWISAVGNCETGSAVTFKRVRDLGLINLDDPTQSLLLLKPLDVSGGGVMHGGGGKFTKTDPTYLSFQRFIEHYSECQKSGPASP